MKKEKLITGLEIMKLSNFSKDSRGSAFEWQDITDKKIVQINAFQRKKDTVAGNHYHKGIDPSKKPEFLFLVSGSAQLWVRNKLENEEAKTTIDAGTVLIVHPYVLHTLTALTDIVYIEPRITYFDPKNPDTFTD